jgi:hypothetical protein
VFRVFVEKMEKWGENGGQRWMWVMQKGRQWYGGWWGSDGWWWVLDFREFGGVWEERNEEGRGRGVRRYSEMGERGRKMT